MGAAATERQPTATQWAVMRFLFEFLSIEDRFPTRAEIAQAFGWRSPSAADDHMQALARRGFLEKRGPHFRFARTEKGARALEVLAVPEPEEAEAA